MCAIPYPARYRRNYLHIPVGRQYLATSRPSGRLVRVIGSMTHPHNTEDPANFRCTGTSVVKSPDFGDYLQGYEGTTGTGHISTTANHYLPSLPIGRIFLTKLIVGAPIRTGCVPFMPRNMFSWVPESVARNAVRKVSTVAEVSAASSTFYPCRLQVLGCRRRTSPSLTVPVVRRHGMMLLWKSGNWTSSTAAPAKRTRVETGPLLPPRSPVYVMTTSFSPR
jgi:hypothetical protein